MIRFWRAALLVALVCVVPRFVVAQEGAPPPEGEGAEAESPPEQPAEPPADDGGDDFEIPAVDAQPAPEPEPVEEDEGGTGVEILDVPEGYEGERHESGERGVVLRTANVTPPPPPLTAVGVNPSAREAAVPRGPVPVINSNKVFLHGVYRGVVPGKSHLPPRARRLKRTRRNFVTWPGFEPLAHGSRIFVQSTRPVVYRRADEPNRIVLVLAQTRINLRNNRNPLVTEHFNTPVAEAYLRHRNRSTELVLEMKSDVSPRIHQISENGYHFLFLEFPPGSYAIPTEIRRRYRMADRVRVRRAR